MLLLKSTFQNQIIWNFFIRLVLVILEGNQAQNLTLQYCGREIINKDLGPVLCLHCRIVIFGVGASNRTLEPIFAHDLVKTSEILQDPGFNVVFLDVHSQLLGEKSLNVREMIVLNLAATLINLLHHVGVDKRLHILA